MSAPSSKSHLYRLGAVLVVAFIGFLVIRSWAIPADWNYHAWYRSGAIDDIKSLPLIHGANQSCKQCHKDVSLDSVVETDESEGFVDEFMDEPEPEAEAQPAAAMVFEHKTLNCEVCHGPLSDHADSEKKIGDAVVMNKSNWQCLNCHRPLISRPTDFPQFSETVAKHKTMSEETLCVKCHDPHNPIEDEVAMDEGTEFDFGDEL